MRAGAGLRDRLLGVGGSRVGLRGIEPALAGRLGGRALLSRWARGGWVIASNARFGSVPLLPGDRLLVGTGCWEGQAAGRDRLLGGTGCWEGAKCFRDRLLGIGGFSLRY